MSIRFPMLAFLLAAFAVPGTMAVERGRSAGPRTVGPIIAAFRKLDRDGNGRLSFNEWHRIGGGAKGMPSKALGLFRTSDLNRNQRLSPYEFARSHGIRMSVPNLQSTPGGRGEGSRGVTFHAGSGRGSNTTSGLAGGSSLTRGGGSTGGTLLPGGAGGGSSDSLSSVGTGAVAFSGSAGTLTPSSGGTTIVTRNPVTIPVGSGTMNLSGATIPGSGSLNLSGGGTIQMGTIQGGTLVISSTFSRYVGLTLEAARQLAESENRASRVLSIDGVRQTVTMDWSASRVNFFLVDGIVKLAIGG